MAITFTEFEQGPAGTGSINMAFTISPSGVAIVGIVRINATGRTLTVTDDRGNSGAWVMGPQLTVGAGDVYYTFYGLNLTTVGNAITVNVASSNGGDFIRACSISYSGIATSSALDQNSSNTGSGTTWTSSSVTTTVANEVIVNLVGSPTSNSSFTPDGAFNSRGSVESDMFIEDKIVSATGSFSPTVTVNAGGSFGDFLLTFADTPISGGPTVAQEAGIPAWPIDWGPRYV